MSDSYEDIFINFADNHEDVLEQMNLSKDDFVRNAKQWSQTAGGKLEIQKFILLQEIDDLKAQITELEDSIRRKQEAIDDIDEQLAKL